jgi:valyl-tRNA synthetase
MTEKLQTSQGYIIRILQHFATKLWNITNFVMLFPAFV